MTNTTTPPKTTTRITYSSTECGRCLGSGHYSFNQIDGTTCFGCKGSGVRFTKAGIEAREAVSKLRATMCTTTASEVQVGDVVYFPNRTKPQRVTGVRVGGSSQLVDGEWVNHLSFDTGSGVGMGLLPTQELVRFPTPEEWAVLHALAETLPGATVERGVPMRG